MLRERDPDALSGVVNARIFRQVLAVARASRRPRGHPPMFLRVALGDRLPGEAACATLGAALRANVRAGDAVGWLGAGGYAVLLAGADVAAAGIVAARLARVLDAPVWVADALPAEDHHPTPEAA
jgi:hypothetical protein